ncbi:MAG: TetR/AcrR family transcriptional regulator [Gammaproteobacteria bacterium]|nr:TetR/AcrR family transcriptional regulator [Gammaproteobacteria bacterium]
MNGRSYGGKTQRERQLAREKILLDTGLELFGRDGIAAVSVRKICRESKLTDRYFYASFDSPEALLVAVYLREAKAINDIVMAALLANLDKPITDMLRFGLDRFLARMQNPHIARVMTLEIDVCGERGDQCRDAYVNELSSLLVSVKRQIQPAECCDDALDRWVGIGLIGTMRQLVLEWYRKGYQTPKQTILDASLHIWLSALGIRDT